MSVEELFTKEFVSELQNESPDYQLIRKHIIYTYNKDTSSNLPMDIETTNSRLVDVVPAFLTKSGKMRH